MRGPFIQRLIDNQIDAALYRNNLSYKHAVRAELNEGAELSLDGKSVSERDDRGRSVSLDQRIAQLKPKYGIAPDSPVPPPNHISRKDADALRENFAEIAK